MVEIASSLLNLEEENSIKTLYNLEISGINYFHIDVMDGKFVEDNTSKKMYKYTNYIKQISTLPVDVHFMVEDVEDYIEEYLSFEPKIITFHIEAIKDKQKVIDIINYIKQYNCNVGIAINPETKLEEIYEFLPYIHLVLVMSIIPGKGGQKFIDDSIDKIEKLNRYREENNLDITIEVDGGIKKENAQKVHEAGADILVVGTAIINSDNYRETVKILKGIE